MWRPLIVALVLICVCANSTIAAVVPANHGLMAPTLIVKKVAAAYGDPKPHILHVEKTRTESSQHEAMYFIQLSGYFDRGHVRAHYLYFSALASRWYVWGLQGYDSHHHLLWIDGTLRTH